MNPHPSFDVNLHNASFQRLDGSNSGSKTGASGAVESCSQHHDAARNASVGDSAEVSIGGSGSRTAG